MGTIQGQTRTERWEKPPTFIFLFRLYDNAYRRRDHLYVCDHLCVCATNYLDNQKQTHLLAYNKKLHQLGRVLLESPLPLLFLIFS